MYKSNRRDLKLKLGAIGANHKIQNEVIRERSLGHVIYFQILEPYNISGTAERRNVKLCMQIEGKVW